MNTITSADKLRNTGTMPSRRPNVETSNKPAVDNVKTVQERSSQADLASALNKINDQLKMQNLSIQFARDPDSGQTIFKVVDDQNNLIRQIPSPEMIEIAKSMEKMQGSMQGLLVSQTA